jgi:hypothetical protein
LSPLSGPGVYQPKPVRSPAADRHLDIERPFGIMLGKEA